MPESPSSEYHPSLDVKEEQSDLKLADIVGAMGLKWKALDAKGRINYEKQAGKDKVRSRTEMRRTLSRARLTAKRRLKTRS